MSNIDPEIQALARDLAYIARFPSQATRAEINSAALRCGSGVAESTDPVQIRAWAERAITRLRPPLPDRGHAPLPLG